LTKQGDALPEDRGVYAIKLAGGMKTILDKKIDFNDRTRIADAMKSLRWDRLVESLLKIYHKLSKTPLSKVKK